MKSGCPAAPPAGRGLERLGRQPGRSGESERRGLTLPALVLTCAFASGAAGLVYEVVWAKLLTLVLGHTIYAVSAVLSAFMAGLAAGSWGAGRYVDKRGDPLRLYAALEAGIGLGALAVPGAIPWISGLHVWIARDLSPAPFVDGLVKFGLALAILLLPTALIGATFPVLSTLLAPGQAPVGRSQGRLYAANTFGSATGAILAGFVLIPALGLPGSLHLGVAVNWGVAGLVLLCARRLPWHRSVSPAASKGASGEGAMGAGGAPESDPVGERLILGILALSGFAALGYEVVWTRALLFLLGNSVYAFSTVVATFLIGLGAGSSLFARIASERREQALLWLGAVQVLIGLTAVASVPLLAHGFHRAAEMWPGLARSGEWHASLALRFLPAFLVMFLPAALMGGTWPLAMQLYAARGRRLGRRAGTLYAANTAGAILGALAGPFVLIPGIGVLKSCLALALLNAGLSACLLWRAPLGAAGRPLLVGGIAVLVPVGLVTASGDLRLRRVDEGRDQVLYYREGVDATVKVVEAAQGTKVLSIDGFPVAGTLPTWLLVQKLLGHLPMLAHPNPRRALVIGLGAGGTAWAIRQHEPDRIDVVELSPEVVAAVGLFPEVNHGILADPRVRLHVDDGRNYLLVTDAAYDVISVDATSPKAAGNGSLYVLEFYRLSRRRLAEGGVLVQWLPYPLLSPEELKVILATLRGVYPEITLWYSPDLRYLIAMGTSRPLRIDLALLRERLAIEGVRRDLAEVGLADPFALLRLFAMDAEGIARFVGERPALNTDPRPVIEFYRRSPAGFGLFPFPRREGFPPLNGLGAGPARELARHLRITDHLIRGRYYEERDRTRSLEEFAAAAALAGAKDLAPLMGE